MLIRKYLFFFFCRLDEEGQMKTGVLCGLGFNPVTNTSLYPDHDIDIGFDVQISTEDLVRVNFSFCDVLFCKLFHADQ